MLKLFSFKAVVCVRLIVLVFIGLSRSVSADQLTALSVEEFKKQFIDAQIELLPQDFSKKVSDPSKFDSKKAIDSYEKFKDQEFDINVYKVMVYNYFLEKKYEQTDKQFKKAWPQVVGAGEKFWVLYNWGISFFDWGKGKENPIKFYIYFTTAVIMAIRGDDPMFAENRVYREYMQAKEKLMKAIEINPNSAEAYYSWGLVEHALFNPDLAVGKFKRAVEINPNYKEAYAEWADNLRIIGKYKESIEKFQKAVELDPENFAIYSHWGAALSKLEKHEEAIEKYKKALELKPKNSFVCSNWATSLFRLGRYDEAKEKCEQALVLNRYNPEGHYIMAKIHLLNNQKEEALKSLEKAFDDGKYLKEPAKNDKDLKAVWRDPEFMKMTKTPF